MINIVDENGKYLDLASVRKRQRAKKIDGLNIVLRKVSSSALGSYRFPKPLQVIDRAMLQELDCTAGQYELWHAIVYRALNGDTSMGWIDDLPHFADYPAMYQLTLSTVDTYKRFAAVNEGKEYDEQIKPFNFILQFPKITPGFINDLIQKGSLSLNTDGSLPFVGASFYAPMCNDPSELGEWRVNDDGSRTLWATKGRVRYIADIPQQGIKAGDVYTGPLMSLADQLRGYAHHPEDKFLRGGPHEHGMVERRHLKAWGVRYHGKESIGFDPKVGRWGKDETIDYDGDARGSAQIEQVFLDALKEIPAEWLAGKMGLSQREIRRIRNGKVRLTTGHRDRLTMLVRYWERWEKPKIRPKTKTLNRFRWTQANRRALRQAIRDLGGIRRPVQDDAMGWYPFSKRLQSAGGMDIDAVMRATFPLHERKLMDAFVQVLAEISAKD